VTGALLLGGIGAGVDVGIDALIRRDPENLQTSEWSAGQSGPHHRAAQARRSCVNFLVGAEFRAGPVSNTVGREGPFENRPERGKLVDGSQAGAARPPGDGVATRADGSRRDCANGPAPSSSNSDRCMIGDPSV